MSDQMLTAVLSMPYDMAMGDDWSRRQFYDRAQQALEVIERLTAEREVLRTLLIRARDMLDWVGGSCEGIEKTVQMVEAFQAEIDAQIEQEKANGSR